MMVHTIIRKDLLDLVYRRKEEFLTSIRRCDVYIVRSYYGREKVLAFNKFLKKIRHASEPSWHPCLDGCPDYHRINDEYPKSYVRARMHSYYFHRWNPNRGVFQDFKEVFEIKNVLTGTDKDAHYDNVPSDGVISRVVSHRYPRGGGYLAEHVDPVNPFSLIQTIIQASDHGVDYQQGGLYIRETETSEPIFLDAYTTMGDMIIASPDVRHAVAPIDPNIPLDWSKEDGRRMILPVIIRSDYNMDPKTKPRSVG
jgi:hypothetical protein